MHELSICQSIVRAVEREVRTLDPPPRRVVRVRVVAGRHRQVVAENMTFAFEVLAKGTPLEGARLDLRLVPITVRCRACAWEGPIAGPLYACGACGAGHVDITGGTELYLESVEVENDDDDENQSLPESHGRQRAVGRQNPEPAEAARPHHDQPDRVARRRKNPAARRHG